MRDQHWSTSPAALSMRQILFLKFKKKPDIRWFHHHSGTCGFRQRVCATAESQVLLFLLIPFFPLPFLLFQSTATFSLISVLSLSLHLSSVIFHGIAFLCFLLFQKCIPHSPWESCLFQFYHDNLLTSFFLEWCFSSAWSFSDVLCLTASCLCFQNINAFSL